MAKHAKYDDQEYIVHVTEVTYGVVVIEAGTRAEAMRIARDVYADGEVSWANQSVTYAPADS